MNWKAAIGKIAPVIGAALGGPLGGAAVSAIASALGLSDNSEEAIKTALQGMTPEQAAALKRADQQFALDQMREMNRAAEEAERIASGDRDSARKREVEVKDYTNQILAYLVVFVWASLNLILFTDKIPEGSEQLVARLLGTLDAALMAVLYYYFGSSAGSQRKTEALNEIAKNKNKNTLQ